MVNKYNNNNNNNNNNNKIIRIAPGVVQCRGTKNLTKKD